MTFAALIRKPTALAPLLMSVAALALIAAVLFGWMPADPVWKDGRVDEGTSARLFQLLILLQVPVCAVFAVKWLPRAPRQALLVLCLQASAVVVALGTIIWLEW